MSVSQELEQLIVKKLRLDANTGKLYWQNANKNRNDTEAGSISIHHGRPRVYINIGGKGMRRARIVYFLHYGAWPEPMCDHINHDTLDDRPINLRAASHTLNNHNHAKRCISVTKQGKYMARLAQKSLGVYPTRAEAEAAYDIARAIQWGT